MFTAQTRPDQLAEALELLRRVPTGHAAVSLNAMPYVLSVRHLVGDGEVLLRTNYGMDDDRLLDGTVVAYEAHVSVGALDHRSDAQRAGSWDGPSDAIPTADRTAAPTPPPTAEAGRSDVSVPPDVSGGAATDRAAGEEPAGGSAEDSEVWTVQLIGVARTFSPTEEDQRRFGPPPTFDDGHDTPVHIRMTPRFASVRHSHTLLVRR